MTVIEPGYVRYMATYNAEMNRRLFAAAARLSDAERRQERGAFWRSIHGTFNHLLWADRMWMSRIAGWEKPSLPLKASDSLINRFDELSAARVEADRDLAAWAEGVDQAWLGEEQVWFSGAAQREVRQPRGKLLVHVFNHQTHHRGQAHAMLTQAGQQTGDTDLFLVVPDA